MADRQPAKVEISGQATLETGHFGPTLLGNHWKRDSKQQQSKNTSKHFNIIT